MFRPPSVEVTRPTGAFGPGWPRTVPPLEGGLGGAYSGGGGGGGSEVGPGSLGLTMRD